jgi:hypothetical protein
MGDCGTKATKMYDETRKINNSFFCKIRSQLFINNSFLLFYINWSAGALSIGHACCTWEVVPRFYWAYSRDMWSYLTEALEQYDTSHIEALELLDSYEWIHLLYDGMNSTGGCTAKEGIFDNDFVQWIISLLSDWIDTIKYSSYIWKEQKQSFIWIYI